MVVVFKGRDRRIEVEVTPYVDPDWEHQYPEWARKRVSLNVSYIENSGERFDQTFVIHDDTMDFFAKAIERVVDEKRPGRYGLIIEEEFVLWIRTKGEKYELKADFNPYQCDWARRVITRTLTEEQLLGVAADLRRCGAEAL